MSEDFYRSILKEELAHRCERNTRYSVRAFANALKLDAGTLSKVLAGKQIPSIKLCERISGALSLSPETKESFFGSVAKRHRSRDLQRRNPLLKQYRSHAAPVGFSIDLYRVISDSYHFAILELTYVDGFNSSPKWIASQLGITPVEASLAIERLLKFGLLKLENKKLSKTNAHLASKDKHLTDPALKKNQRQFLEKAIHSLENNPTGERIFNSMTMAIDPEKLPAARQMMVEFSRDICKFLESGKRKRVYNLQIALYPIQKKSGEKK